MQAPRAAEEPQSPAMKGGSPRRLTAKTSSSMFSCSAAKQYERLDHLASARKSVIEADIVAHLQQATLGHAASLQLPVGLTWLAAYSSGLATASRSQASCSGQAVRSPVDALLRMQQDLPC